MVTCAGSVTINKCCPRGQSFNGSLLCAETTEPVIELASDVQSVKFDVNYGVMPCSLHVNDGKATYSTNFVLMDNGSVVVPERKNLTYSTKNYCLDIFMNQTVGIICPCIDKVCILKCCAPGSDLKVNYENYGCKEHELEDWYPNLVNKLEMDHEMIIYDGLLCPENKKFLYVKSSHYINSDGSLWTESHGIIESGLYCGDYRVNYSLSPVIGPREKSILACLGPPISNISWINCSMSILGLLILILTIAIQLILPDTPWLWTKMLILHLGTMSLAYLVLILSILVIFTPMADFCISIGM